MTVPGLPTSALSGNTSIQHKHHQNSGEHDRANHWHDRARSISAPDQLVSEIDPVVTEHYRLA
ncbi:hypothetical protein HanRHA438_Chr16g0735391 [Helianthus annuus]|nr:hypothetical protein HanRHA438_Chr16g0735391 [Helianthus annuus]